MARHRILIVGAPASGRSWLAGRIHDLTGIPVLAGDEECGGREWLRLVERAAQVARALPDADLVVLMRTPLWLRCLRVVLRRVTAQRAAGAPRASLRATRRWTTDELPAIRAALDGHAGGVMSCQSSEDVRAVLERVFGLTGSPASPVRAGPPRPNGTPEL